MNPFFHTDFNISDSLKTVRKSVLIYETIIVEAAAVEAADEAAGAADEAVVAAELPQPASIPADIAAITLAEMILLDNTLFFINDIPPVFFIFYMSALLPDIMNINP